MNEPVLVRPATPEDIPAIFDLLNGMYRNKWPLGFYRWQCFNDVVPSVMFCAFAGTELVATFGMQKRQLTGGLTCGQASWLNVAPAWQGRGLFTTLGMRACGHFSDLDALCVFANEKAKVACERGLGFRTIGAIAAMVLQGAEVGRLPETPASAEPVGPGTRFPALDQGAADVVAFACSPEFRSWRFANPAFAYEVVRLKSGEYAVIKTFTDPTGGTCYGDIVDMECPLLDEDAMRQLIAGACRRLAALGATAITTWALPGSPLRTVIDRLGFHEGTHKSHFGLRVLNAVHDQLYSFTRWHLRQADATNY